MESKQRKVRALRRLLQSSQSAPNIKPSIAMDRQTHLDAARISYELRETFKAGHTKSTKWRTQQLEAIYKMVEENEKDITKAIFMDLGRPAEETFAAEISRVLGACKVALKELRKWMSPNKDSSSLWSYNYQGALYLEPVGVALILSSWGFPLLFALDPLVGAIAAGNAVVVNLSEVASATATLLVNIVPIYLDPRAICIVNGSFSETRELLEQKWDTVYCTGSPSICKMVMTLSAKFLTPITVELVGKCPAVVDSTADIEVAARQIVCGKWANNNGQSCISPDFVVVEKSIASTFIGVVKDTLKEVCDSAKFARIASFSHFVRLTRLLDDPALSKKIIFGGQRDEKRLYIAPTIVLNAPLDTEIMTEEIFGPLLPVITVDTMQDAIKILKSLPKPLALYVFTNERTCEEKMINACSAKFVFNGTISNLANARINFGVCDNWMKARHVKGLYETFSCQSAFAPKGWGGDVTKALFMSIQAFIRTLLMVMNDFMLKLKSICKKSTT